MTEYPKPGDTVDLLTLRDLRVREKINVYLYMDEEIAKNSTVEEDIKKYSHFHLFLHCTMHLVMHLHLQAFTVL